MAMVRRPLLAAALVAAVVCGLLGPTGCSASASADAAGGLPVCCAQKAVGAGNSCCCSSEPQRAPAETPAPPVTTDDRGPAEAAAMPAGLPTPTTLAFPLDIHVDRPTEGSNTPVYVFNCIFLC